MQVQRKTSIEPKQIYCKEKATRFSLKTSAADRTHGNNRNVIHDVWPSLDLGGRSWSLQIIAHEISFRKRMWAGFKR